MPVDLKPLLPNACFAFRGYNIVNLGRSPELLAHSTYGPTVRRILTEASEIASEATGRKIDLILRVEENQDTSLDTFADAVAGAACDDSDWLPPT